MMTGTSRNDELMTIETKPDLPALLSDFRSCTDASSGLIQQQCTDFNTRFALWSNQFASGRKESGINGEEPRPWRNASDVRVFEADATVNERVRIMLAAWTRGSMQISATESPNQYAALKAQALLQWLFKVHLRTETYRELQRYCQWREQWGLSAM